MPFEVGKVRVEEVSLQSSLLLDMVNLKGLLKDV